MKKTRIIIVDDHKIVRDGVKLYLQNDDELEIIDEAGSGEKALERIRDKKPDLVLMDLSIGDSDGIEITNQIIEENPQIKVIALTMHKDYQFVQAMLDAGASGYILKNCDEHELRTAIRTVIGGEVYYDEEVTKMILSNLAHKQKTDVHISFTPREKEVYKLILQELSNQEIADKLFISIRTVEVHKRNLMEKTGAKSSTGLVLHAVKNKLFNSV